MIDFAFVFPGQGSQYSGMGKLLAYEYLEAQQVFAEADEALAFRLSRLCFEGPDEELKKTENTQPALLAVSVAAHRVLLRNLRATGSHRPGALQVCNWQPALVAGHSLGEYSALVAAGSLAFGDAVRLVRKRAQYMQAAVPQGAGAMAAILKLPDGQLDSILAEAAGNEVVTAANFNSPEQVVIAGHVGAVERAMELAKRAGARRAVRLPVSAPFHCPLMLPAQQRLESDLKATAFGRPAVPLINNWQARRITTGEEARRGLYEQIPNPVRWTETIREMAHSGIRHFVEVGAGSVLLGLLRNIDPSLVGVKFGEPADMAKVEALLA